MTDIISSISSLSIVWNVVSLLAITILVFVIGRKIIYRAMNDGRPQGGVWQDSSTGKWQDKNFKDL
jgi:hypothetical protein